MKPEYDCPMLKKWLIILAFTLPGVAAYSQSNPADTTIPSKNISLIDTTIDYDALMQDLDTFLDSILSPHSYLLTSLSMSKGFYNFEGKGSSTIETSEKLTYSPTIGYYDKSGFGITGTGYIVNDESKLNFYQFSLTPSYDFLANRSFATGISYSHYFTKKSLPFYTSPLQNDVSAYFTWRRAWVKPSVSLSYGWGSRSDYQSREELVQLLRLRVRGFTYINTKESVSDFSVMASVRHDFYWLDVFTYNDHIRFTPQVAFTSGTQKFGFNQSSSTYTNTIRNSSNVLYSTENVYLDNNLDFQPLSATLFLRGEYSIGKFFVQPQLTMDYYFPSSTGNFTTLFSVNMGFMF